MNSSLNLVKGFESAKTLPYVNLFRPTIGPGARSELHMLGIEMKRVVVSPRFDGDARAQAVRAEVQMHETLKPRRMMPRFSVLTESFDWTLRERLGRCLGCLQCANFVRDFRAVARTLELVGVTDLGCQSHLFQILQDELLLQVLGGDGDWGVVGGAGDAKQHFFFASREFLGYGTRRHCQ